MTKGLLQAAIFTTNGLYVSDIATMELALVGSPYGLDREQTELNDGIAMITTETELEAARLMEEDDLVELPSGFRLEIPTA